MPRVICETSHLRKDVPVKFSRLHLHRVREMGLQGAGRMGCMYFPTNRLSLWKSDGNLTHIRKNLVIWIPPPIPHFGSSVGSSLSRMQMVPFLFLSATMLVCVLFIVNSVWEQRTFSHLCRICSDFTQRTSFISRAAKSCWAKYWFLQLPVPWQIIINQLRKQDRWMDKASHSLVITP